MTISDKSFDVNPECMKEFGCRPLEGFVMRKGLISPDREKLLERCVEFCLSEGTDQVCYMADSFQSSVSSSEQGGQNA